MSELTVARRKSEAQAHDVDVGPRSRSSAAPVREPVAEASAAELHGIIGNHGVLSRSASAPRGDGLPTGEDRRAAVRAGLTSPSRPLAPGLRNDMEARVGRAHSGHATGATAAGAPAARGDLRLSTRHDPAEREADRVAGAGPGAAAPASPDFGAVRVHTGSRADASARALGADAYTLGNDVVFADGAFAPETAGGRRLLVHELTHVAQGRAVIARQETTTADRPADAGDRADTAPPPALIPAGGTDVNKVGIVNWDGEPEVRLRSGPDTSADNIVTTMPFNTHVQVLKRFPGDWYFVATDEGDIGYVYSKYIWTHLPEPNARLHRVQSGRPGYAIEIAERFYGSYSDNWGQDLRFYVAVLGWANRLTIPNTTDGWKQVHFKAGNLIWIPSHEYALSLKGIVNSGSRTYEIAEALGVAGFIKRVRQLSDDIGSAISRSGKYLPEAIGRHLIDALVGVVVSLALLIVGAIALLAVMTALGAIIGAAVGALAGGAGAIPGAVVGAEIGFETGLVLLDWLGIALLITWVADALWQTGKAFYTFLVSVWDARGDDKKLDVAAKNFAEFIGTFLGKIFEGLLFLVAARGTKWLFGWVANTRFGRVIGETKLREWVSARSSRVERGRTKVPTPRRALRPLWERAIRVERLKGDSSKPGAARAAEVAGKMERAAKEAYEALITREAKSPEAQKAYEAIDNGTDWSGAQFGRALEAEMQLKLEASEPNLVYQRSVAVPEKGLPNRQPSGRPDWRLGVGEGREAVYDATMGRGSSEGKALKKYDAEMNEFIYEILYRRPPHVGDAPPVGVGAPVPGVGDDTDEE